MSVLPDSARVLFVEDEPDIRDGLADLLRLEGWTVAVAADGAEGLEVAAAFRPDLVILDLAMPVLDGFGFLRRWTAGPSAPAAPVIVLTARQKVVLADPAVVAVVEKPFDVDELLSLAKHSVSAQPPRAHAV